MCVCVCVCLALGPLCQPGCGCGSEFVGERVCGAVSELPEHLRRLVGHGTQHPAGERGVQYGAPRGESIQLQLDHDTKN